MNPMNKHLTPEQIAEHADAVDLRRRLNIPSHLVAKAMGYKSEASVCDFERLRYRYPAERIAVYARAVRKIAKALQPLTASPGCAVASRMPTVTAPVDAELLAKFRERRSVRKASGTAQKRVALEMTQQLGRAISKSTVCNIENEKTINPMRAAVYIAVVDKLCGSSQIPITMQPTEPLPPRSEDAPVRASIAELVAIINRCNEELRNHRAAVSASFGRPISDAAWDAIVADVTTP